MMMKSTWMMTGVLMQKKRMIEQQLLLFTQTLSAHPDRLKV